MVFELVDESKSSDGFCLSSKVLVISDNSPNYSHRSQNSSRRSCSSSPASSNVSQQSSILSSEANGSFSSIASTIKYSDPSNGHIPFEQFKPRVIELCRTIGFGEPDKITRMKGGSFNRVIGLSFLHRHTRNYVLRATRNGLISDTAADIKDQVAILHHLFQCNGIPVAPVVAFDSTKENSIGSAYMIQERFPGQTMDQVYYELPLAEKLQITTNIAELMLRLEAIPMEKPGRLVAKKDLRTRSLKRLPPSDTLDVGNFRIQKFPGLDQMQAFEKQPLPSLLKSILHERIQWSEVTDNYYTHVWKRLYQIVIEMEEVGLFRISDSSCIAWPWDFAAKNVMISQLDKPQLEIFDPNSNPAHSRPGQQKIEITLDASSYGANTHSVDVVLDPEAADCNHQVQVSAEGVAGKTVRYIFEIGDRHGYPTPKKGGDWVVTGVVDLDDIKSFPRIVARCPPQWLWSNSAKRTALNYDYDQPPKNGYSQDELTIKAHFDQIMQRADPTYMDDAYNRGPWIRRLVAIALERIDDTENFDILNEQWKAHYGRVFKPTAKK